MHKKSSPHRKSSRNPLSLLAIAVKERRIIQGLTQVELAARSGVSLIFIREFEQGKSTVRLDKVQALADFLGLELRLEPRRREVV